VVSLPHIWARERAAAGRLLHEDDAAAVILQATCSAPDYARPTVCVTTTESHIVGQGLLNRKGEPLRAAFARYFNETTPSRHEIRIPLESTAS